MLWVGGPCGDSPAPGPLPRGQACCRLALAEARSPAPDRGEAKSTQLSLPEARGWFQVSEAEIQVRQHRGSNGGVRPARTLPRTQVETGRAPAAGHAPALARRGTGELDFPLGKSCPMDNMSIMRLLPQQSPGGPVRSAHTEKARAMSWNQAMSGP